MRLEDRLVDALSEFDRVEPAPDLFARVEASVERDRLYRRRVRRFAFTGLAATMVVAAFLWASTDRTHATISGWAVFVAQLVILTTAVVVLGRIIPRFGQAYVSDVFRLDPRTAKSFLRLHDVAFHLVFGGYVVILSWHRQMAGPADIVEAIRFLLDRTAGLFLLMGLLHAATLMTLPVIGLVHGTIVRDHARALAGEAAPPADPQAVRAARIGRMVVWIIGGIVVVQALVGLGLLAGLGLSDS
jgi:hypothetical protein